MEKPGGEKPLENSEGSVYTTPKGAVASRRVAVPSRGSQHRYSRYSVSFQENNTAQVTPIVEGGYYPCRSYAGGSEYRESVDDDEPLLDSEDGLIPCDSEPDLAAASVQNGAPVTIDFPASRESVHCHVLDRPGIDKGARRKLIIASILCLIFMAGEVVGGYLANSLAIMTDAAHLLTDFASFMISLFSLWMATRPATKRMSFGWHRAEVIGAITSVLLIWVVTGILVYIAIERILLKTFEVDAVIMLITSAIGVVVNIIMAIVLQFHGGGHGHAHGGGASTRQAPSQENINVRAAFVHVVGDLLQSLGVLTGAVIIFFKQDWMIVDPICTFIFSVLVLITTFAVLKDALTVLMLGFPKGIDFDEVKEAFLSIPGVERVHNLRIWSLSLDKVALSAHLAVMPGSDTQQILKLASQRIRNKFSFYEMTIQIEDLRDEMDHCDQCRGPT